MLRTQPALATLSILSVLSLLVLLVLSPLAGAQPTGHLHHHPTQRKEHSPSLPEGERAGAAASGPKRSIKLGEKIALDQLGPIVVNEDGTLRRISNWDQLTKAEQETTLRRVKERNAERLAALNDQQLADFNAAEQEEGVAVAAAEDAAAPHAEL